jgi:hypothetical protein
MDEDIVTSGFLIEKTFGRMCRDYLAEMEQLRPDLEGKGGYSTPRRAVAPEEMPKQYRGLQREPLQGWTEALRGSGVVEPTEQELEASLFLDELETTERAKEDFILSLEDAKEVMGKIVPPVEREIIWARRMEASDPPLAGAALLGYEPTNFWTPCCYSAIAEGMFFTYPTGMDVDGLLLQAYHEKLNKWGLFDTPDDAERYLEVYLSSVPPDWDAHRSPYYTVEVRALA